MAQAFRRRVGPARALFAVGLLLALVAAGSIAQGLGPAPAAAASGTAKVEPEWQTLMSEGFEGAFPGAGWTVSGMYFWDERDCNVHGGSYSAWAIGGSSGAGFACGANYPNNLQSAMTYGPFNLTGYTAAELEFWYWFNTEPAYDYFRVFASPDGSSWINVVNRTGSSGGWQQQVVDLKPYVGDSSVWIRFAFDTDVKDTYTEGVYVDDIVVRAQAPLTANYRSVAANDGWVRESTEASEAGGTIGATGTCRAGDDAADRQYRSILDFNTRSLPDDAVILSVVLEVKKTSLVGDSWSATHGALLVDIRRGGFNKAVALEIMDFQAAANLNAVASFVSVPGGNWFRASLSADALAKINLTGHTQFRVRYAIGDDDDGAADYFAFACGDALTPRSRPVLRVTYVP